MYSPHIFTYSLRHNHVDSPKVLSAELLQLELGDVYHEVSVWKSLVEVKLE